MSKSKATSHILILVELMNLTFERELVAGGTQMSNSLHQKKGEEAYDLAKRQPGRF
jgi:hypothetical protein